MAESALLGSWKLISFAGFQRAPTAVWRKSPLEGNQFITKVDASDS